MRLALLVPLVACCALASPRLASACCGPEPDALLVKRVFTLPGTDLYLVEQFSYLDYLGNGIGPGWKHPEVDIPSSIDDCLAWDYVIYDADLHPLAGILADLPRSYENGKPLLKEAFSKLGELPKSLEDQLRRYQTELGALGGKRKKKSVAPRLEARLGAVPLPRTSDCGFEARVTAGTMTVSYFDKLTKNKLPVGDVAVSTTCYQDELPEERVPVAVTGMRCYLDAVHARTLVVVTEHCEGECKGKSTDHALVLGQVKLAAMRENVAGYRDLKEKRYASAREHFDKSVRLSPDYAHASFNLACTMAQLDESWRTATGPLERLLSKDELRATYRQKLASDGDLEPWRKDPTFLQWVRATSAKYEAARKIVVAAALSESQAKARTLNAQGMRLYKRKDLQNAEEKFEEAAKLDPRNVQVRTNAASVQALRGNEQAAIAHLAAAIKISKARTLTRLREDHDYDGIRETPAFRALLETEDAP